MKAKSLHFSKSGSAQIIASELGRVYQSVCDQIPPAYPCEGEKVVFVGVEMTGKVPSPVDRFCRDLTPSRAQNVAIYVDQRQRLHRRREGALRGYGEERRPRRNALGNRR